VAGGAGEQDFTCNKAQIQCFRKKCIGKVIISDRDHEALGSKLSAFFFRVKTCLPAPPPTVSFTPQRQENTRKRGGRLGDDE
jgi:hypothetical protein